MTTFSQLIDEVSKEMLRPDLRVALASYVNQTIREMHFRPGLVTPVAFDANRFEEMVSVTSDGTWLWTIPSATRFQKLEAVWNATRGIYLEPKTPRVAMRFTDAPDSDSYYYRSGPTYAFFGVAVDDILNMSYMMFPQTLSYKQVADRLVTYNADTDSYLLQDGTVAGETQLDAETNWMIQRWSETVKEGARAKAYKRLGDEGRMRVSFSAFETMRAGVWQSEPSS